ncbi:GNAT family N-acetyltransferase [Aliiroseovarius sp.]|uniref:GNAT family N-acetyltransferase n=1 Tax=Aliiroseovarius sp. TaxID=1872442 RepID=UPI003BA88048
MSDRIEIRLHDSLEAIAPEDWDACACPEVHPGGSIRPVDPFTTHRFLHALEVSGSVGKGTGWEPHYLTVHQDGQMIACAPLYAKGHSQGEYVFDHSWAHALEDAGGRYYPKLQIAVPFTPATGRRFLTRPGFEAKGLAALIQGAVQVGADNGLSSLHVTFCTEDEAIAGDKIGLIHRLGQQYHWEDNGYADFDGFLATLSSRKRKNIRKERATAQGFGGQIIALTGDALDDAHWDAFWHFYQDTGARKWGSPYLTREFFDQVHRTMADDILLVMAERDGVPIAGALNFIGRDTLYGRYWGAREHHPCLHFELCYYQAIDHALAMGLTRVEAGAQGDHKLARGYMPVPTHSLHWIADPGFRDAVSDFVTREAQAIGEDIEILTEMGPFKRSDQS